MAQPCQSVCSPWATLDDLCAPCLAPEDEDLMESYLNAASDILFALSGKQFPGICQDTFRPNVYATHARRITLDTPAPRAITGTEFGYGAPAAYEIDLGITPVTSIEEVIEDGVVIDPSLYRVDDFRWLVRLRDADGTSAVWPSTQSLDPEDGEFSVTFSYGINPPVAGVKAAAILGCELYVACTGEGNGECRLPKRIQSISRQGVSYVVLDPFEFLSAGRLGIPEIDYWIASVNPNKLQGRSHVVNIDTLPRLRRANTGT